MQDQNLKKIRNVTKTRIFSATTLTSLGLFRVRENILLQITLFFFTWLQTSSQNNKSNNKERFNWVVRKLSFPGKHYRFKEKRRLLSNSYRNQKPQWYIKPGQVLGKMKNIFESANCMTFFLSLFPKNFLVWKRRKTAVTGVLLGCTILCDNHSLCNDFSLINEGFI